MFSIILATRDRPILFEDALRSVIDQDFKEIEIIIVNDGSSIEFMEQYELAYQRARDIIGERIKFFYLTRRPRGHGQSYSLNFGVDQAVGDYVLFLDDDDIWIDSHHLSRFNKTIINYPYVDLYLANQEAYFLGEIKAGPIWLEPLEKELIDSGIKPDLNNVFSVPTELLMSTWGFCHLNCLAVRRDIYLNAQGMDEGIRWECDRDIFLRLVDLAKSILFSPAFVSRHNIPNPAKSLNMSTTLSVLDKRLYQIRVLDKAALFSKKQCIRNHALRHKGYALKKIAEELAESKTWPTATYYAKEALGPNPTLKWMFFTLYCVVRSWQISFNRTT